jgi:hypothetical protein
MAILQNEKRYKIIKLTLDSGESLEATAEHPFYIKGKGWNPASSLKVGQALQLHNGTTVVVTEIDTSVRVEKVYNLTVANTHNYFVGEDGVLVHNCKIRKSLSKKVRSMVKNLSDEELGMKASEAVKHRGGGSQVNALGDAYQNKTGADIAREAASGDRGADAALKIIKQAKKKKAKYSGRD